MRDRIDGDDNQITNINIAENVSDFSAFDNLSDALKVAAPEAMGDISFHEMPVDLPESGKDLLGRDDGFVVGSRARAHMRANIEGHLVTIGQPGSGKGRATVIPNLLMFEGSVFSFEISGTSYKTTHHYRREGMGQDIYLFDPLKVTGDESASFNVFDILDPDSPQFYTAVDEIADSLIAHAEGIKSQDKYWENAPKDLLKAMIIYVKTSPEIEDEDRHLPYLTKLLYKYGSPQWDELMKDMQNEPGVFSDLFNSVGTYFGRERTGNTDSLISYVRTSALGFAADPAFEKLLKTTSVDFRDLREKKASVYVVLPETKNFKTLSGFVRLLTEQAFAACPNIGDGGLKYKDDRILFILDEFTQLGKLDIIDTGIQTARQKGISIWTLFQDYARLCQVYGEDGASSIMGAAGAIQVFNAGEVKTRNFISEMIGNRMVAIPSVQHAITHSHQAGMNFSKARSISESTTHTITEGESSTDTWSTSIGTSLSETEGTQTGRGTAQTSTTGENFTKGKGSATSVSSGTSKNRGSNFGYKGLPIFKSPFFRLFNKSGTSGTFKGTGTQKNVGKQKSEQTVHTDVSSESTSESRNEGQFSSVGKTTNTVESTGGSKGSFSSRSVSNTEGESDTEQEGHSVGEQKGAQYTVSYTYQKMPAIDPSELRKILGFEENQILILNTKGDTRCFLDVRPNYDQVTATWIRAYGHGDKFLPAPTCEFDKVKIADITPPQKLIVSDQDIKKINTLPALPEISEAFGRQIWEQGNEKNKRNLRAISRMGKVRKLAQWHTDELLRAAALYEELNKHLLPAEQQVNKGDSSIKTWIASLKERTSRVFAEVESLKEYHEKLIEFKDRLHEETARKKELKGDINDYKKTLEFIADVKTRWRELNVPTRPKSLKFKRKSTRLNIDIDKVPGEAPDLDDALTLKVPEYKTPPYKHYSEPLYTRNMVEIFDMACAEWKLKKEKKDVFLKGFTETLAKAKGRTNKFVSEQMVRGENLTRIWNYMCRTNASLRDYEHKLVMTEKMLINERQNLDDKRKTLSRVFVNICAEMAEAHESLVTYPAWDTMEEVDESQSLG